VVGGRWRRGKTGGRTQRRTDGLPQVVVSCGPEGAAWLGGMELRLGCLSL